MSNETNNSDSNEVDSVIVEIIASHKTRASLTIFPDERKPNIELNEMTFTSLVKDEQDNKEDSGQNGDSHANFEPTSTGPSLEEKGDVVLYLLDESGPLPRANTTARIVYPDGTSQDHELVSDGIVVLAGQKSGNYSLQILRTT